MARFDTGHRNLEDVRGIGRLWNSCSFGFTIVAFPMSNFWPLMVYNMVHGVRSAVRASSSAKDEALPSMSETKDELL